MVGGDKMKVNVAKLDLALARRCKTMRDLREGVSPQTLTRVKRGEEINPRTLGRIANCLGVDPSELIEGVSA